MVKQTGFLFGFIGGDTDQALGDGAGAATHGVTLHINGALMCRIADHRVAPSARSGIIALQMHPGPPMKIQFKNLRLKELK